MQTIRQLREARGMTQTELARELGVSLLTVGNWERNAFEPRASQLRAVARLFGIPMESIAIPKIDDAASAGKEETPGSRQTTPRRKAPRSGGTERMDEV